MFKRLEFYFVYLLLQLFRFMPFFLLYAISRFAFFLTYYIVGYRKKVVVTNLQNSFPEKSPEEIREISRKFFMNFCDVLAETIKGSTMSEDSLKKRFIAVNPELLDNLYDQNRSVILVGAHYANSEWGKILSRQQKHPIIVIYSPFMNKYVDRYYNRARIKFGMKLVNYEKTLRAFGEIRNGPHIFLMGVDQRPFDPRNAHWLTFLNQDTPCHKGYEQIARKLNIPVVYSDIQRVKKGYYTIKYIMLCEEPAKTEEGFIVTRFMQTLEQILHRKPEDWLWSHKRWKYRRPSETN